MKWSQLLSLKFMDRFFNHRYFSLIFWLFVVGGLTVLVSTLAREPFQNMELSLLDIRLRSRAQNMAPSEDIVLVAADRLTENYIRNHPNLGIRSITLPRQRWAQIVNYVAQQGAKAIVFDLELKDTLPGDDALEQAMWKSKNVYAATRMDSQLKNFLLGHSQEELERIEAYHGQILPYMTYRLEVGKHFMRKFYGGMPDAGLGPFVFQLPYPEAIYFQALNRALFKKQYMPVSIMSLPRLEPASSKDILKTHCLNDAYQNTYKSNPAYLKMLYGRGFSVQLEEPMPDEVEKDVVRCYMGPIANRLMANVKGVGITAIRYEPDGFLRKVPVLYQGYRENFYLYLGMQTALDAKNISQISYTPQFLRVGNRLIHIVDGNEIFINWRNPKLLVRKMANEAGVSLSGEELKKVTSDQSNQWLGYNHFYRAVSAIDIIRKIENYRLDQEGIDTLYKVPYHPETGEFSFKNKIVVIGNTTNDIHRTPAGNTTYGPEILMNIIDMLMHDDKFVHKPDPLWTLGIVIALAAAVIFITIFFESLFIGFTIGILLIVFYWFFNFLIFNQQALWFELVTPTINLAIALTGGTLYRYYIHDKEKHHLTDVFSKYVSPQIMDRILQDPEKAMDNLRGGKKELTVLFSDLQGFTHQFENADPEIMVNQLNGYFDVMTEIILQHGGTYDKYMGDSIMAFFGAPTDVPNHAEMACRAAIEMMKALRYLNDGWKRENMQPLSHGIGISTGEMFVGNFGSKNIKNFTVMGSNVNLGARLEAYTRVAQWPIIISERTRQLTVTQTKVRDLGKVQVKGFREPVQVYGLEKMIDIQGNVNFWKPSKQPLQKEISQQ